MNSNRFSSSAITLIFCALLILTCQESVRAQSAPVPVGLVGWWAGETNALDTAGTNNGILQGGITFALGEVGNSFLFNTTNSAVKVSASSSLNVGSSNGFTVELWINPSDITYSPLAEWNNGTGNYGAHFYIVSSGLSANIVDNFGSWHPFASGAGVVSSNTWQHVALTYDKTTGIARYYKDGVIVTQQSLGTFTPQTSYDFYIGRRPPTAGTDFTYKGLLDEMSLYNRALTSNEIASIYSAGSAGKTIPLTPPLITTQPTNQTVTVGQNATFSVQASGSPTLTYQWRFNTTNIVWATNASITLTNVQLSQAGNYSVVVSNLANSVISSNALLAVNGAGFPLPSGLVAWWRAENNALDSIGTNNGTLIGGASYVDGEVGTSFLYNTTDAAVMIPASSSLNVGLGSGFTIECWVYPSSEVVNSLGPLLEWNTGSAWGAHFYIYNNGGPGSFFANIVDDFGNWHTIASGPGIVSSNVFQHLALTYDKTSGVASLYRNGNIIVQQNLGTFTPLTSFDLYLGRRPGGDGIIPFTGRLDEVSLYNRALNSNEITGIYSAGSAGKNTPTPTPPFITLQPTNQTVTVGQNATFSVQATGSPILNYQWRFNSTNIVWATNATITLTNVQFSQAGNYSVLISNFLDSVISSNALLTVNSNAPGFPLPPGLIAWWQAENNALDSAGTYHGTLQGAGGYTNGMVGKAFGFHSSGSYMQVPDSPAWAFGTNEFTIELWARFNSLMAEDTFVASDEGGGFNNKWIFWRNGGQLQFFINAAQAGPVGNYAFTPNLNQFYHMAVTRSGTNYVFYINGVAVQTATDSRAIPDVNAPLTIGFSEDLFADGDFDEVSIYSRALTSNEIAGIHAVGSLGKSYSSAPYVAVQPTSMSVTSGYDVNLSVLVGGAQPLAYQWWKGLTNILGATNATLTLTNVQVADSGIFYVVVTNLYGSATSSNAVLTVTNQAPLITSQPQSNNVAVGESATFTVSAVGSKPLSYQWRSNGTNVINATNASYSIPSVKTSDAGFYSVVVSNFVDIATSSNAALTVTVLPLNASDDFEPGIDQSQWSAFGGSVLATNLGGFVSTSNSLWFGGSGSRFARTRLLNTVAGGPLEFNIRLARGGAANWETVDLPAKGIVFEYSINRGTNWTEISRYDTATYTNWSFVTMAMPVGAKAPATYFRWRQLANSGGTLDNWALDNVFVGPQPPLIAVQPTNQIAIIGSNVTFTVVATGTALNYQWLFNGTNISWGTNLSLTLTNVQLGQAGNYAVSVSNIVDSMVSSNALLTVRDAMDHFTWDVIPSPRFANNPFVVSIQARDVGNQIYTNFTGTVVLSDTNGAVVNPTVSGNFVQGVWTGTVTIAQTTSNLVLKATEGLGRVGLANPVSVINTPAVGLTQLGGYLLINWPVSPSNFVLETSGSILPANWQPVPTPPFQIGDQNFEYIQISPTNGFFRLRFIGN